MASEWSPRLPVVEKEEEYIDTNIILYTAIQLLETIYIHTKQLWAENCNKYIRMITIWL